MSGLKKFFAVTARSLYRVSAERNEPGWPAVIRIDGDEDEAFPLGTGLKNGRFVGLICGVICLYNDHRASDVERPRPAEMINTRAWGGHTSGVVALFFTEDEARACFAESDRKFADPRWKAKTLAVLEAIGENHPVFVLGQGNCSLAASYSDGD
ncbi:MAG: hypothetical protein WC483_05655 [Candidatus Paceibacterota bacterium]